MSCLDVFQNVYFPPVSLPVKPQNLPFVSSRASVREQPVWVGDLVLDMQNTDHGGVGEEETSSARVWHGERPAACGLLTAWLPWDGSARWRLAGLLSVVFNHDQGRHTFPATLSPGMSAFTCRHHPHSRPSTT